jgi:hypothetical protein
MKKILLSIALVFMTTIICAQTYNTQQKQLISEVQGYLSGQGYSAEEQEDGLKFKNEGINYFVEVSKEDQSPMFLRLCRYVKYSDTIKQEVVTKQLNTYNAKLGIKVSIAENGLVISTEMYVKKASDFTNVFPTLLSQIKATYKQITD